MRIVATRSIAHQCIGRCLALILPQIVLRVFQRTLQAREENRHLVRFHLFTGRNQLIAVIFRVEIQQVILLGKNLTALVEFAARNANILIFRCLCCKDHFHRFEVDTIDLAQRR